MEHTLNTIAYVAFVHLEYGRSRLPLLNRINYVLRPYIF